MSLLPASNSSIFLSRPVIQFILPVFLLLFIFSCKSEVEENILVTDIVHAEKLAGLEFRPEQREMMQQSLQNNLRMYKSMREHSIENSIPPALIFNPLPPGFSPPSHEGETDFGLPSNVEMPENTEELAFYTVAELSALIRSGHISSVDLTSLYLERLKKHDEVLKCVVTLTEELAMEQAERADRELAQGIYRGPLHGIPYGIKDLFAVKGYPTTWGATPYKDQVIDENATVVEKLEEAGAVLLGKLTLGALAMGDVWFADTTRSPWNPEIGSSGSSAGSASAMAAGLVAFSIGTETLGSIVSPSTRCGTTGLRPTYGRVSRSGAMALSWSMDKVGPICRSAHDAALVFEAIYGTDGKDLSLMDFPFYFNANASIEDMKIGYFADFFEEEYRGQDNDLQTLEVLREMGVELIPVSFDTDIPVSALRIILNAEAAAAFDDLTRSGDDDMLVRQNRGAWPNIFRTARFIPAVEYIQANRFRQMLSYEFNNLIKEFDVIVTPSYGGNQLLITNLTGHPCVIVPNGFDDENNPTSISFLGNLFDEATLLAFVKAYQDKTEFHLLQPPDFTTGN